MKQRDVGIEILKIFCIGAVVALHTQRCISTGEVFNPIFYYASRFAMPVFFMINGYLILNRESFSMAYYKKKTINIVRVLVTWGIISVFYSLFLMKDSLREALKNGIKCIDAHYIVPLWFLFTFFIIYTLLLFGFGIIKANLGRLIIFLAIICIVVDIFSLISIFGGGYFLQSNIPQRYRLWTWMFYFMLGYFLGKNDLTNVNEKSLWVLVAATTIIVVIYQYLLCYKFLGKINSEFCYDNILIMLWSTSIFLLFKVHHFKHEKMIELVGKHCFGVFLLHEYFSKFLSLTERISGGFQALLIWCGLCIICWIISWGLSKVPYIRQAFRY